ncbi:unnamed protein product [Polarella glacialis]|uniref:Uncharacterized protein n=1 Tax=Polarella glacialis TaxID=89957 RepID=A0A813KVJ5_POLGL|nr:unnamed protein product [Polarella glacialis]
MTVTTKSGPGSKANVSGKLRQFTTPLGRAAVVLLLHFFKGGQPLRTSQFFLFLARVYSLLFLLLLITASWSPLADEPLPEDCEAALRFYGCRVAAAVAVAVAAVVAAAPIVVFLLLWLLLLQ